MCAICAEVFQFAAIPQVSGDTAQNLETGGIFDLALRIAQQIEQAHVQRLEVEKLHAELHRVRAARQQAILKGVNLAVVRQQHPDRAERVKQPRVENRVQGGFGFAAARRTDDQRGVGGMS